MTTLSLKKLLVPSKAAVVEFPGFPGFKINVAFLSRETMIEIRKKATVIGWKNRLQTEEIDDTLFLKLYTENAVKGWTGLKLEYLNKLAPVDLEGQDLNASLEYSDENALFLMQNSTNFDAFISGTVTELNAFTKPNSNSLTKE